jgi:chaperonin GroES
LTGLNLLGLHETMMAAPESSGGPERTLFISIRQIMRIEPLGDKIVVKRMDAEEKTAGGILLPEAAREKPQEGKVLSVGNGRMLPDGSRADFQVEEGDRVLFSSYAGTEITIDDTQLLIMTESDILAVMG